MQEKLLKLLEKAIKSKDYRACQILTDAIVALETGSQIVYYAPEFSNPTTSDEIYDTYEYIEKNIIN